MPGIRDNQTVDIRVNSWGSIIQELSKFDTGGSPYYYKLKSASGDPNETLWGDHFFLRAVQQGWPGADGTMRITKINRERYDAEVIEQGQSAAPNLMEFVDGQMQQVPMPDQNGVGAEDLSAAPPVAPVAPVAPVGAPKPPPAATAPSAPATAPGKLDAADALALMKWAMSSSYALWDDLCSEKLGEYEKDNTFWLNLRTTADTLYIHCTRSGIRAPAKDGADSTPAPAAAPDAEALAQATAAKLIAGDDQPVQDDLPF